MKRALLVVEVQNDHVDGAEQVTYPSLHVSMPNIAMAMDWASSSGTLVVEVQRLTSPGNGSFVKGSRGGELHPMIVGNPCDARVHTLTANAFANLNFAKWLKERDVTTVTLVGYTIDEAVKQSAWGASAAGLRVELLADATGARSAAGSALSEQAVYEQALTDFGASLNFTVGTTSAWHDALVSGSPMTRSAAPALDRDGHHSKLQTGLHRFEWWAKAKAGNVVADNEAYKIQHTFDT
jgi:nicotinamidase-related amidase